MIDSWDWLAVIDLRFKFFSHSTRATSSTVTWRPRTSSTPAARVSRSGTLASARWAAAMRLWTRSAALRLTLRPSSFETSITSASLWTSGPSGWCCSSWWRAPCPSGRRRWPNWSDASWRGPTSCPPGCQRRARGWSEGSFNPFHLTAARWSRWWAVSGSSLWTSRGPWSPLNWTRPTLQRGIHLNSGRRRWR